MGNSLQIRESQPSDVDALVEMYPKAFPEEDLVPVLRELLNEDDDVLSLVGVRDENIVGHVIFSICGIDGQSERIALLGPLAVDPDAQKQGIGSAVVRAGFDRLKDVGLKRAYVLGDPNYYGRFGFKADSHVAPPYKLPVEWEPAWQSVSLTDDDAPELVGKILVPAPWQHAHLWLP